jgi:NTE family protein
MPFLANYTVSVLNSPSFSPIQEARTIYQPIYHAHNYLGAGLKNILIIRNNIEVRMEAFVLAPHKTILSTGDNKAEYGPAWSRRIYCASMGPVFHSPLGPIGLFVNYFEGRKDSFSFLFHFGYFIFNRNVMN